jgi:dipeptidyl aminopeptidase/acylaminoacyl peptidase
MYGTWDSPLSPPALAGQMTLDDARWDSDGQTLVWLERRAGKGLLVMQRGREALRDLTDPQTHPVSGGVGYGGGEFTVAGGVVIFASRGRLYRLALAGGAPQPVTPAFGQAAAPALSADGRWIAFVHSAEGRDGLCVVDAAGQLFPRKLAYGSDFVMQPAWHPRGTHLACVAWNHPQMPWNGSELRLITLAYDTPGSPYAAIEERLAGDTLTAIAQPAFSPDGRYLAYLSDASGWGQLYVHDLGEGTDTALTAGEFEVMSPAWIQGIRQFAWSADSQHLLYLRQERGHISLWRCAVSGGPGAPVDIAPYTFARQISTTGAGHTALIASAATVPTRLITVGDGSGTRIVRRTTREDIAPEQLAPLETLTWPGLDGETVHGLYYPPHNPDFSGRGQPPLLVLVHGGPTSQRHAAYLAEAQFFATRGYGVLLPNHRGSTGYGRAYMDRHAGQWGVYDVQDSLAGARFLGEQGRIDPAKCVIMGSSAGGYTVLQSLVDYPGFYKAGISAYGVANQFALALDTHKFEARYSDWLLGELPAAAATWRDRSPVFRAQRIQDACFIAQGTDDTVVPRSQSEAIVAALRKNGVPHEYVVYEGEGHGWRKPETIADYYERILRFLLLYVLYA